MAVEDGLEALRRVDEVRPDLVVLDLDLPRLPGQEVGKELKARPETSNIPIMIVTGKDTSDLDPSEFACVIRKPVNIEQLLEAVQNCLRDSLRRKT